MLASIRFEDFQERELLVPSGLLHVGAYIACGLIVGQLYLVFLRLYNQVEQAITGYLKAARRWKLPARAVAFFVPRATSLYVLVLIVQFLVLLWGGSFEDGYDGQDFSRLDELDRAMAEGLAFFWVALPFILAIIQRRRISQKFSLMTHVALLWPVILVADMAKSALFDLASGAGGDGQSHSLLLGGSEIMVEHFPNMFSLPLGLGYFDAATFPEVVVFGTIGLFLAAVSFTASLHWPIVRPRSSDSKAKSLSIVPDADDYIDDDGYLARLDDFLKGSNAGVIGITGLRGAGKSALMRAVERAFEEDQCVVWTVAPVRPDKESDLSYLRSVCRTVCLKTIDDARSALYGRPGPATRAFMEFLRRLAKPLLIMVAIVLGLFTVELTSNIGGAAGKGSSPRISTPLFFMIGGHEVPIEDPRLVAGFQRMIDEELDAIDWLLRKIDNMERSSSEGSFVVAPARDGTGFELVGGDSDQFGDGLAEHQAVLSSKHVDIFRPSSGDQAEGEKRVHGLEPLSIQVTAEALAAIGVVVDAGIHADLTLSKPRNAAVLLLRDLYVGGRDHAEFDSGSSTLSIRDEALVRHLSQAMFRGYPGLKQELGVLHRNLRGVLSVRDNLATEPGLATSLLLHAYLDAAVELEFTPDAPVIQGARDVAGLTGADMSRLHAALTDYKTLLENGARATRRHFDEARLLDDSWLPYLTVLRDVPSIWKNVLLIALVLLIAPHVITLLNFVFRVVTNYPKLLLMRESEKFLEELEYSASKQSSSGFNIRGVFSFSGSRSLASRSMTLQSLTDRYQEYVSVILPFYNGKLILMVDELDKMSDPEDVRNVILQLKGALFQHGCYYVMSLSQDCARAFRGRLTEGRDIFESTFDDILDIRRIQTGTARNMIRKRLGDENGISDDLLNVLIAFCGAIPREIVRLVREPALADGLEEKDGRRLVLDLFRAEVTRWRGQLEETPFPGGEIVALRQCCRTVLDLTQLESEALWPTTEAPETDDPSANNPVQAALWEALDVIEPAGRRETMIRAGAPEGLTNIRGRDRHLELQACLRLMILEVLARTYWNEGVVSEDQLDRTIDIVRLLMDQTQVAEEEIRHMLAA